MVVTLCYMASDGAEASPAAVARWTTLLAGVSIIGTVLAALSVFALAALAAVFAQELGGEETTWWYWGVALGFATAGVLGLLLTSRLPVLAYLLRLTALLPWLLVGFASPWLMLPGVLVASAHVSLMLRHWAGANRTVPRVLAGLATAALVGILVVPLGEERHCENPGDPPASCERWYVNLLGWGYYEDDNRNVVGWVVVALLGGLVVALPASRDSSDGLV